MKKIFLGLVISLFIVGVLGVLQQYFFSKNSHKQSSSRDTSYEYLAEKLHSDEINDKLLNN